MQNLPFVSIIIPTYKRLSLLQRTLECLFAQTYPAACYEIIVVDDDSPDGTADCLRPLVAAGRVRYIRQAHAGPAAARNKGAQAALGDILAFTDNDCLPEPDWIETLVAGYNALPDAVAIGGLIRNLISDHWLNPFYLVQNGRYRAPDESLMYLDSANASFRRDIFLEAGGFPERLSFPSAEDMDLGYRFVLAGYPLHLNRKAVVWHVDRTTLRGMLQQSLWRGRGQAYMMFEYSSTFKSKSSQGLRLVLRRILNRLVILSPKTPNSVRPLICAVTDSLRAAAFTVPQLAYFCRAQYPHRREHCHRLALGWSRTRLCLVLICLDYLLRLLGQVYGTFAYTYQQARRGRFAHELYN